MKQKQNVDELPRHVNSPKPGGKLHSKHRPEKKVVPGAELFILLQKELQKRDFFGTLGILYVYDWAKYVYCLQICLTQPFRTMNLKFILFLHSSTKFGIPKSLKVGYWMSLAKWDVDICWYVCMQDDGAESHCREASWNHPSDVRAHSFRGEHKTLPCRSLRANVAIWNMKYNTCLSL